MPPPWLVIGISDLMWRKSIRTALTLTTLSYPWIRSDRLDPWKIIDDKHGLFNDNSSLIETSRPPHTNMARCWSELRDDRTTASIIVIATAWTFPLPHSRHNLIKLSIYQAFLSDCLQHLIYIADGYEFEDTSCRGATMCSSYSLMSSTHPTTSVLWLGELASPAKSLNKKISNAGKKIYIGDLVRPKFA